MQKLLKIIVYKYLLIKGFKPYMANHYANMLVSDFLKSKISLSKKIWAYKKGFLSQRIIHYGITEDNYKDYLSDYDYYKMFPLNGSESKWIDDKLTTKYILAPYDEFMPAYYFILNRGKVTPLHNSERSKKYNINDVLEKLKEVKVLALKMEAGFGGEGFYKLEYSGNNIIVNEKIYTEDDFISLLCHLDNYLVMEYIIAHDDIRKYYSGAPGVLRIMVINDGISKIVNAYLRIGSSLSGNIDAYTGSISAIIDLETGLYSDAWMHDGIDFKKNHIHPDSHIPFEGVIPKWDFVKEKILEISSYLSQLKYLGFDVGITEDGFKIFEINSHQGIELFQLSYPLLKNNDAADFFKAHIK